ncbi:hypothetical protein, partial [Muriicola sp.]|uniref:hypothetical protein n=1 Tax=Muriicola sp. TaxID=2020856 RepID=UPI003C77B17B
MEFRFIKTAALLLILTLIISSIQDLQAQESTTTSIQKSTLSLEIDPVVPIVLHGFSGHLMWKPKKSNHLVYGIAIIVGGELPTFIINL